MNDKNTSYLHIARSTIEPLLTADYPDGKTVVPIGTSEYPVSIVVDKNISNPPEVHESVTNGTDLVYVLSGDVRFIIGGELEKRIPVKDSTGKDMKNEFTGKKIISGAEIFAGAGDIIRIPHGVPHQHGAQGTAILLIFKI